MTKRALISLICLSLALYGCGGGSSPSTQPVQRVVAVTTDLEITISENGQLKSANPTNIIAKGEGKIVWLVKEGSTVAAGDTVIILDNRSLNDRISQTRSSLELDERDIASGRAALNLHDLDAERLRSEAERTLHFSTLSLDHYALGKAPLKQQELEVALRRAQNDRDQAAEKAARMPDLLAKGFVTASEVRDSDLEASEKRTKAERAQRELDLHRTYEHPQELAKAQADVLSASMAVLRVIQENATKRVEKERVILQAQGQAAKRGQELAAFERDLRLLTITTSTGGTVVYGDPDRNYWQREVKLEVGADVQRNQQLMQIPDLSKVTVEVGINQIHVARVSAGMRATVTVEGTRSQPFTGTVTKLDTTPMPQNWGDSVRKYAATIALSDTASAAFRPGMDAKVVLHVATRKQVVAIPVHAVSVRNGESWCWVENNGMRQRRRIELGFSTVDQVEVRSGLAAGETVLVFAIEPGDDAQP